MSQITKSLTGFLFNGADLTLATATFKNNIGTLYGINSDGTGYTSYKPASSFNSLPKLVQNGSYILSATASEFELPGATLAALSGGALPVYGLEKIDVSSPAAGVLRITVRVDADGASKSGSSFFKAGSAAGVNDIYSGYISHNREYVLDKSGLASGNVDVQFKLSHSNENGESYDVSFNRSVVIL